MSLQTTVPFKLPCGYMDKEGVLHRVGVMRLATGGDEIAMMKDPRVQADLSYATIILLSRVITQLGTLKQVDPTVIESLFSEDLRFLENLYQHFNAGEELTMKVTCPQCGCEHVVPLDFTCMD